MSELDNGVAARHSSATAEHYTPRDIVEAARATLGGFDLDPFSCAEANETVHAAVYFDGKLDAGGFSSYWRGRVFVNPPGGREDGQSNQKRAWFKFMAERAAGRVSRGLFVCFSLELLQTTQVKATGLLPLDFPVCYPSRRIAYRKPGGKLGKSPPHSSCLVFVPPRHGSNPKMHDEDAIVRFRVAFGSFGKIVVPS